MTYIEIIGTVIASSTHNEKQTIQLLIGEPNDIINNTEILSKKDVLTIELDQQESLTLGSRAHIQGNASISNQNSIKIAANSKYSRI